MSQKSGVLTQMAPHSAAVYIYIILIKHNHVGVTALRGGSLLVKDRDTLIE